VTCAWQEVAVVPLVICAWQEVVVVEVEVVVAAGKEAFRLECAKRQNVVLISIYLVLFCFAEVGVGVAAVVEDAAAVVVAVVVDVESRVKSQRVVSGECWHTV
jgi:hypothetical protein